MIERPDHLGFLATRVLKAVRSIAWGIKGVWLEDWYLDKGPEGAWISASNLAERIGQSKDNVEEHRRFLRRIGLYFVIERKGARSHGWVPTMPDYCIPRSVESIIPCRDFLEEYIHGRNDGTITGLPGPANQDPPGPAMDGVVEATIRGVAKHATPSTGGKGGTPTSRGTYVPLPLRDTEQQEGGLHKQPRKRETG